MSKDDEFRRYLNSVTVDESKNYSFTYKTNHSYVWVCTNKALG